MACCLSCPWPDPARRREPTRDKRPRSRSPRLQDYESSSHPPSLFCRRVYGCAQDSRGSVVSQQWGAIIRQAQGISISVVTLLRARRAEAVWHGQGVLGGEFVP